MKKYGYIRVSTREQHTDRQMTALEPFHIPLRDIFCDYQSGKDFSRPAYQKLLRRMRPGDLLVIKSIDRLGRNYTEILNQWQYITKTLRADILVIDMPLLDTREKEGDLTGVFIADLVLQILAYVAQTERDMIRQRQIEGIAAARLRGVHFGRERIAMQDEFHALYEAWITGDISLRNAAKCLGISHMTFYRRCMEMSQKVGTDGRHFVTDLL